MDNEYWVTLSIKTELMIIAKDEKFKINKKRFDDLKHQFNKYSSYKKVEE